MNARKQHSASRSIGILILGAFLAILLMASLNSPLVRSHRQISLPAGSQTPVTGLSQRPHPPRDYVPKLKNPAFEQPGSLISFFEKLKASSSPVSPAVHILQFGDSHTAADQWTGDLRSYFQQRFGNGGPGYIFAGHPFAGYHRALTKEAATSGWRTEGLEKTGDGYYGLGGLSLYTDRAGESVSLEADCTDVGVYYLQFPGAGEVEFLDNGRLVTRFSADGFPRPLVIRYAAGGGLHKLQLVTKSNRPVRLLGWSADNRAGATYESLGINGAQASIFFRWKQEMISKYLQARNPALVILAYGSNEATDANWTTDSYRQMFSTLLRRLRNTCPESSILVLGPGDRIILNQAGAVVTPSGLDRIIAAQKSACKEIGCAYWDARGRMGGAGAIQRWFDSGLAQDDLVHLTPPGYSHLADMLFSDLMRLYNDYLANSAQYPK